MLKKYILVFVVSKDIGMLLGISDNLLEIIFPFVCIFYFYTISSIGLFFYSVYKKYVFYDLAKIMVKPFYNNQQFIDLVQKIHDPSYHKHVFI